MVAGWLVFWFLRAHIELDSRQRYSSTHTHTIVHGHVLATQSRSRSMATYSTMDTNYYEHTTVVAAPARPPTRTTARESAVPRRVTVYAIPNTVLQPTKAYGSRAKHAHSHSHDNLHNQQTMYSVVRCSFSTAPPFVASLHPRETETPATSETLGTLQAPTRGDEKQPRTPPHGTYPLPHPGALDLELINLPALAPSLGSLGRVLASKAEASAFSRPASGRSGLSEGTGFCMILTYLSHPFGPS